MTPRPYRQGRRQAAAQKTRAKVLRAARALLTGRGTERFSLDSVAERAGVARMTVYYQFRSRRGLIEALFDSFAEGGELPELLGTAFQKTDPEEILGGVVNAFAHFWQAGRSWVRRVRALGVLDAQLGAAIEARNARRRQVVRAVVDRTEKQKVRRTATERAIAEEILYALTSFEMFDQLAGPTRRLEDVAPMVLRLARAALNKQDGPRR
ncbi:MAG TPA: helix-turn-helix domain-containing protein [Gemmatimonadales bacterium]|nr:helix-turn-helix domain-containing protein [Gemmatimonadales bacterium]